MGRLIIPSYPVFYKKDIKRNEVAKTISNNFDKIVVQTNALKQREIIQKIIYMKDIKVLIFVDEDSISCLDKVHELNPDMFHVVLLSLNKLNMDLRSDRISMLWNSKNIKYKNFKSFFNHTVKMFHASIKDSVIFTFVQSSDFISETLDHTRILDSRKHIRCTGYKSKDFIYLLLHHLVTNGVTILISKKVDNLVKHIDYENFEKIIRSID